MADIKEVVVDWTTNAGGGFVNVFYFGDGATITAQRTAIDDLFDDMGPSLDTGAAWQIRNEGVIKDEATGTLTGAWSDSTPLGGTGQAASESVPDAAQILLRWATGSVVNGRFLKGRTFVPGFVAAGLFNGNVSSSNITLFNTACDNFLAAGVDFGIWHRPASGTGGTFIPAVSGSTWQEMAVLTRRRK